MKMGGDTLEICLPSVGACCRIEGIVRLRDGDTARIAAHLGMGEADFPCEWTNEESASYCLGLKALQ